MNTIGQKMFDNYKASRKFTELYNELDEQMQKSFGKSIRAKFSKKIISDEEKTYYLTEEDVINCYQYITR